MAKHSLGIMVVLLSFSACVGSNNMQKLSGKSSLNADALKNSNEISSPNSVSASPATIEEETKSLKSEVNVSAPQQNINSDELQSLSENAGLSADEVALLSNNSKNE